MNPETRELDNPLLNLSEEDQAQLRHWANFETSRGDMGERGFVEASALVNTIQRAWRAILTADHNPEGYLGSVEGHSVFYNADKDTVFTAALPIAYSSSDCPSVAKQVETGFQQVVQYLLSTGKSLPGHIKIGFMVNHTAGGPAHWVGISADYDCTNKATQQAYEHINQEMLQRKRFRHEIQEVSPFERAYGQTDAPTLLADTPLAELPALTATCLAEYEEFVVDLFDANEYFRVEKQDPNAMALCLPEVQLCVSSMDSIAGPDGSSYQSDQFLQIVAHFPDCQFKTKPEVTLQSGLTCMDHACWNAVVVSYLGFVPELQSQLLRYITDASEEEQQAAVKNMMIDQIYSGVESVASAQPGLQGAFEQRRANLFKEMQGYKENRHRVFGLQVPDFIWGSLVFLLAILTLGLIRKPLLKYRLENTYNNYIQSARSDLHLTILSKVAHEQNEVIEQLSSPLACCYGYDSVVQTRNRLGAVIDKDIQDSQPREESAQDKKRL